ncbi:hypothetical protein BC830DRAFT_1134368 [Chytriomyces sp. MP71]|nr:hypothetical protein BC830DRAFT_1134368 [Chytriomyces sp. MP71]
MHSSHKFHAQWHKTHHLITSSASIFQGMAMDLPDYLLEHFTGAALLAFLFYGVFGVPLNAWSLLLDVWIHASVHSANSVACVYLNPVLDALFKWALAHGVHHVEPQFRVFSLA